MRLISNRRLGMEHNRFSDVAGGSPTSTIDMVSVCNQCGKLAERFAIDRPYANDSSRSLFRAHTVLPKTQSLISPTHYVTEGFSPLEIPGISKNNHSATREGNLK